MRQKNAVVPQGDVAALQDGKDIVQVLDGGDPHSEEHVPQVKLSVPGTVPIEERGDATSRNRSRPELEKEAAEKVRYFRVTKGGSFLDQATRNRVTLHEGKEIDSRNYNIRNIQQAGIRLEVIENRSTQIDEANFVE